MIKKFNELYDNDDLKHKFEIPHLRGEMNVSKFKNIPLLKDIDESTELFFENIILEYSILGEFKNRVINLDDVKMIAMFASSYKPVEQEGHKFDFYAQLGIYFADGFYGLHIILRDLNDMRQENWEVQTYEVEDIKEAYQIIDSFMMACDKLNIIKPEDKFSIKRN